MGVGWGGGEGSPPTWACLGRGSFLRIPCPLSLSPPRRPSQTPLDPPCPAAGGGLPSPPRLGSPGHGSQLSSHHQKQLMVEGSDDGRSLLEGPWAGDAAIPGRFLSHVSCCSEMLRSLSFPRVLGSQSAGGDTGSALGSPQSEGRRTQALLSE